MVKARERKSNLPPEVSTLGPVYLPTKTKDKYRDACAALGVHMEADIKNKVNQTIKQVFPEWEQ